MTENIFYMMHGNKGSKGFLGFFLDKTSGVNIFVFVFLGISVARARGSPLKTQQGLRITEDLAQRVEVVYVLGLFLLGKHRKKVSYIE